MKTFHVDPTTQKGQYLLQMAQHNLGLTLSDCYMQASEAKYKAWQEHYGNYANNKLAKNFRIVAFNMYNFTVAWDTPEGVHVENKAKAYDIY